MYITYVLDYFCEKNSDFSKPELSAILGSTKN